MVASMLSVNDRVSYELSDIDVEGGCSRERTRIAGNRVTRWTEDNYRR